MIAPDHGLIHRGEKAVRFIIDMYRNWPSRSRSSAP